MTAKTMLGLVVLAVGLGTIPTFAEIATPYKQFQNGSLYCEDTDCDTVQDRIKHVGYGGPYCCCT